MRDRCNIWQTNCLGRMRVSSFVLWVLQRCHISCSCRRGKNVMLVHWMSKRAVRTGTSLRGRRAGLRQRCFGQQSVHPMMRRRQKAPIFVEHERKLLVHHHICLGLTHAPPLRQASSAPRRVVNTLMGCQSSTFTNCVCRLLSFSVNLNHLPR